MANEMNGEYVCGDCGCEATVTKEGSGTLTCCDKPMAKKEAESASDAEEKTTEEAEPTETTQESIG